MGAVVSLKKLESFNIHRFLRRSAVERLVVALKVILIGAAVLLLVCIILEYFKSSLDTSTKKKKFENDLENYLKFGNEKQTGLNSKGDYSIIASKSIFGKIGVAPTAAPKVSEPAPKPKPVTTYNLIGTFVFEGKDPYAIIEEAKKKTQDVFLLGDTVFEEAKLVSIQSDRVEIERNGAKEILLLDAAPDNSDNSGGGSASGSDSFVVDEADLDQALENLPLLLTQARAVPFFKEGRAVGLRLFAIKSGSLFEKIGLQNGDVLKSVNGNSLGDLSQAMQLFQKLKEERSISVVLDRNLQERQFNYQIR